MKANLVGRLRRTWAVVLVGALAVVAFLLATEPWIDPSNRFRIIMGALLLDSVSIVWLLQRNGHLFQELRSQHRAATYVRTLRGMVSTLLWSLESDAPMPPETRIVIYRAMAEQLDLYDTALGDLGSSPGRAEISPQTTPAVSF